MVTVAAVPLAFPVTLPVIPPTKVPVIVPPPDMSLPPIAILPDIVPPASGSFVAIELVTVVLKLASSPKAAANSFNVLRAEGAESTRFAAAVSAYAVVAILVELSAAL